MHAPGLPAWALVALWILPMLGEVQKCLRFFRCSTARGVGLLVGQAMLVLVTFSLCGLAVASFPLLIAPYVRNH
jgi:hypothetical protein